MKAKININGKEVEIELTEEQTKAITEKITPKRTGYELQKEKDKGIVLTFDSGILGPAFTSKASYVVIKQAFDKGNYFADLKIAEDRARLFNILNAMYRWAVENTEPVRRAAMHFMLSA